MPNLKEIKNRLESLGLTEKQATIYMLLLEKGELRIQEIADLTRIPRTSVYENLDVLLGLGLAERVINDNFVSIKPYPLGSMRHGLNEKLAQLQSQMASLEYLEKSIEELPKNGSTNPTTVRYYKGVSGARQLLWNTLKPKDTIYVYSAWGRGRYVGMKFYKSFVRESRERGFSEKVLVNPSKRVLDSIRKYAGSATGRTLPAYIRALKEKDVLMRGETFIYDNIFAQLFLREEEINGFEIESANFVQMQKSVFETLWKMAKPVTDYLPKRRRPY